MAQETVRRWEKTPPRVICHPTRAALERGDLQEGSLFSVTRDLKGKDEMKGETRWKEALTKCLWSPVTRYAGERVLTLECMSMHLAHRLLDNGI